ncbi:hypothetical protein GQ43DRAFT_429181 [Delitschia confertaspora ATCC 74209]|uniref:Integral membrane protein-like protein n=1 Tax=Delitschia confertaspora ATCC 74209 TaxID=1513339 RepID=A0A9P4MYE2_9PLEO|nr:hypothetical protein GQ43DRAFT_429181 [Delitschia confertaspora ATCC 74209]
MRPLALIPALCCAAALVLSFLCLFAGHKKGFMEDYHLLTLNTSRIGSNLLNSSAASSSNPLSSLFHNISDSISNEINDRVADLAERIGVEDFYSAHLLDYCYGSYVPSSLPNSTVSKGDIHKDVEGCSNRTTMYHFDPTAALERSLNESGLGVTLGDLNWPEDIQKGIDALRILQKVVFVLYCIAIGIIFIALLAAILAVFASGRLAAGINIMIAFLAFLAIGLASAIVTAVTVKGTNVINQYGKEIGVEAHRGGKFLAITWAATGAMLIAILTWCFECCTRRSKRTQYVEK